MTVSQTGFGIPLPARRSRSQTSAEAGQAGRLVADFLSATDALSCEAAAEQAGVRTETIRKWRRRLPRWLKQATSRRITAWLAGTPPPDRDADFRRSFRRVLRNVPGAEHGPPAEMDSRIPP